jgi:hypothetical protein
MTAFVAPTSRVQPKTGAFGPMDVALAKLWLRADLGVTLNSGNVATWADQSGNANDATESTNRPLWVATAQNGQPCVRATSASSHKLILPGPGFGTTMTMFVVASKSSTGSGYITSNDQSFGAFISNFSGVSFEWFNNGDRATLSAGATGPHILTVSQKDGTNVSGWFDGGDSTIFSGAPATALSGRTFTRLFCSGSNGSFASCDIYEVLFYNQVLAQSDRAKVHAYLKARYAL